MLSARWTSTTGDWPETVTVSSMPPTDISTLMVTVTSPGSNVPTMNRNSLKSSRETSEEFEPSGLGKRTRRKSPCNRSETLSRTSKSTPPPGIRATFTAVRVKKSMLRVDRTRPARTCMKGRTRPDGN